MKPIINPAVPNLPLATKDYESLYQEQLNNTLRLYFNQLNNLNSVLIGSTGGAFLQFPNGAWHQDGYTTLAVSLTNTSTTPIQVASTAGFLSAGALIIDSELIIYTGKTATTFTGITRGAYGSSKASHTAGVYVAEAQPVPSSTTELVVSLTATDTANGIDLDPTDITKVVAAVAGYYNIQFSAQLLTFDSSIDNVTLWFRQNGVDVPYSAGIVSIPAIHGGKPGAAIVSWNLVMALNAGDYFQLIMASDSGNTVAATYPPGTAPVHPASPSIILTATFVSALYT
jgi:uracil-DNA glycosylase